jgi:predicted nucleic acid-binding protein
MIIDTTYLLPLARIEVDTDLLRSLAEKRISEDQLRFEDIQINSISLFEMQAKAAKLGVKAEYVLDAIEAISKSFKIEPFYSPEIIRIAHALKQTVLSDYIDCIILALAIALKEALVTEDSRIWKKRKLLKERFELEIVTFRGLVSK